jgi:uncharacterized membrane protein
MRKILLATAACLFIMIPVASLTSVSADTVDSATPSCSSSNIANYVQEGVNLATGASGCDSGAGDLDTGISALAGKVVNIFSVIVGVVAVIMVIYGGFRYIISGGDSSRVGTAKNTLIYAIIGLIIVALAQLIVHYVLSTTNGLTITSVGFIGL